MAIPLSLGSSPLFTDFATELTTDLVPCLHLGTDHRGNTVLLLLRSCLLLWEHVYLAVAEKRLWYIRLTLGRCIATALHATLLWRIDPLLDKDLETNSECSRCCAIGESKNGRF
jgi:hypothetical protein